MLGLILKTAVALVVCLVAADIIGALGCTFFDVMLFNGNSPALPYAIWFVLGVFCGLIAYNLAGAWSSSKPDARDWTNLPGARRVGYGVLIISALIMGAMCWLFYAVQWSKGVEGEYYVPDSEPHSIVFFGSVLGAMLLAQFVLMPKADKPASGGKDAADLP